MVTCLHGLEDCAICRASAALDDWSVREVTRFMCTDELKPETALALEVFMETTP